MTASGWASPAIKHFSTWFAPWPSVVSDAKPAESTIRSATAVPVFASLDILKSPDSGIAAFQHDECDAFMARTDRRRRPGRHQEAMYARRQEDGARGPQGGLPRRRSEAPDLRNVRLKP